MPEPLPVPYHAQISGGYCLAACAQMALGYLQIERSQTSLADQLKVEPYLGAPARNIRLLASPEVAVVVEEGTLEQLRHWLDRGVPPIAFVEAGELPHWQGERFQHAVVLVSINDTTVAFLDPDFAPQPAHVSVDEFLLAWGELNYLYAALAPVDG